MATVFSGPKDFLICSVCTEVFTGPISLSCQHTFCTGCLRKTVDAGCLICPVCGDPIASENFRVNRILRDMADEVRQRRVDLRELKRSEDVDVNNWENYKMKNVKTSKSFMKEDLAATKTERKLKSSLTTGPWEGIHFGIMAFCCFISVLTSVVLPCVEFLSVTMSGNAAKVFGSLLVFISMFVVFSVVARLVDFVLKKFDLKDFNMVITD